MDIDFDSIDNPTTDFTTVPPGRYRVRVAEVRLGTTRAGDDRWSLRLVVCDPSAPAGTIGKQAAWDALVFTQRGMARVRSVFKALDLPCTGKVQVDPEDLVDRTAFVTIRHAEYWSPSGDVIRRTEVPYDGWEVRK